LAMEDVVALKKLAIDYLHPEMPVKTTDATVFGRNYFSRPTADYSSVDAEEQALILADLKALKQAALDYLHPEVPVKTTDSTACGRNYFSRYSAPQAETPEEAEARALALEDSALLKKLAVDYLHPEMPIKTTDATASGRNYFDRYSAPVLDAEEDYRRQVLADAALLKKLAVDYMHPERPVVGSGACARNYFDRPSSTLHHQMIHTFPPHDDDWSDDQHEHVDHFGMDEEMELFADLRERLAAPIEQNSSKMYAADSDVGSNLSRSPSSVMLFGMDESNNHD
jgi:hypothetical protein